ncbi:UNVERIFIED_CONTAM: hypothetical protein NCL1_31931 [Trichonephila clavipes]
MECWWYIAVVLSFCVLNQVTAINTDCPHPEDSYPCYCDEDEERTTMHCNYLQENKQIRDGLGRISDYKLSTVSIWMFDTGVIKSDAFKGPQINEIVFSHSTINMESPPFLGQEDYLNRITFLSCYDEEDLLNTWSLGHLNKLKEVTFEKNDIKVLKNDWISSVGPMLRSVTFDNCKIEKLEDKVFSKLTSMTTIFLMDNKITTISRSMFPRPAENLRSISMKECYDFWGWVAETFGCCTFPSLHSRPRFEKAWMPASVIQDQFNLMPNPVRAILAARCAVQSTN